MISVKSGTQTWSTAEQKSALKADPRQTMSATDQQKALGDDENLGNKLNKLADPNWIDPSEVRRNPTTELDKDAFLKLFLAQLKNQDPTNPMQSHELSAQLAQFSSLEKLNSIDTSLAGMAKAGNPQQNFEALSLIGKAVAGDSSRLLRSDETETHDIAFNLLGDAQTVTLRVFDSNNLLVRELDVPGLDAGQQTVAWDGRSKNGQPLAPGEYRIDIEAVATNQKKVGVETKFGGRITGVNFSPQGAILMIGKKQVRLSDVKSITDPVVDQGSAQNATVQSSTPANSVGTPSQVAPVVKPEAGARPVPTGTNLGELAMSRGLVDQLEKQVGETGAQ